MHQCSSAHNVTSEYTDEMSQPPKYASLEREVTGVREAKPLGAGVRPGVFDGGGAWLGVVSTLPLLSRAHQACKSLSSCSRSGMCCSSSRCVPRRERT